MTPVETVSRWLDEIAKQPTCDWDVLYAIKPEVRDAIAALAKAARERAWLPIETAPRDGTRILVLRPSRVPGQKQAIRSRVVIAKWHNGKWHKESMAGSKNSTPAYAIAWMPLPSNEGNYITAPLNGPPTMTGECTTSAPGSSASGRATFPPL